MPEEIEQAETEAVEETVDSEPEVGRTVVVTYFGKGKTCPWPGRYKISVLGQGVVGHADNLEAALTMFRSTMETK